MSIYSLTITVGATVQVNKDDAGDYQTAVEIKPPHVNGLELAGNGTVQKLGNEGAKVAVIAALTATLDSLRTGEDSGNTTTSMSTPDDGTPPPTMPGASA